MDTDALLRRLDDDAVEHLWVIYHDYGGRSCAKSIPRARFAPTLRTGVVFARANLDFTLDDHQAPGASFLADSGDFLALPDPSSYAPLPYRPATARVHAWMRDDDGAPWEGCPRTRLQQVVAAYAARGLSLKAALEPEFFLFKPLGEGEYRPADRDGMFTVAGLDRHAALLHRLCETLGAMGVAVEQIGKEYGPGQYEGSTGPADPLSAVDNYLTFKEVVRALAREAGLLASFMPKPYAELPGCGLHLHLSIWDSEGQRELSSGESEDQALSALGGHFAAGILKHAPAIAGVAAPTVNSYKRLLPGSWAPAHICWGIGNRAALIRVPGLGRRRRLEFRAGDNTANPFLLLTAVLAAGLAGIAGHDDLPPPVGGDVGHFSEDEARAQGIGMLPRTLGDALAALEADPVIAEALGPTIHQEFLKVKRAELAAYDMHVHPWERRMYLEAI
jgi:glutamine synthetase